MYGACLRLARLKLLLGAGEQRVHEEHVVGGGEVGPGGALVADVEQQHPHVALLAALLLEVVQRVRLLVHAAPHLHTQWNSRTAVAQWLSRRSGPVDMPTRVHSLQGLDCTRDCT